MRPHFFDTPSQSFLSKATQNYEKRVGRHSNKFRCFCNNVSVPVGGEMQPRTTATKRSRSHNRYFALPHFICKDLLVEKWPRASLKRYVGNECYWRFAISKLWPHWSSFKIRNLKNWFVVRDPWTRTIFVPKIMFVQILFHGVGTPNLRICDKNKIKIIPHSVSNLEYDCDLTSRSSKFPLIMQRLLCFVVQCLHRQSNSHSLCV